MDRLLKRYDYQLECRSYVKEIMEKSNLVLFFDKPHSWQESFFALGGEKHKALFLIMPTHGHWKLRCIPPNYENRMQVRMPLPEKWAGLHDDDLKKESKIDGAIFCHKGLFISIWETKEDAIKALKYVFEQNGIKDGI